jgi:Ca2+-binding RTX toxin-like protein
MAIYSFVNTVRKLYGTDGPDKINGSSLMDDIYGGFGDDTLYGHDGADQLFGGYGWDALYGGSSNDDLYGQGGEDWLYGEDGDDLLDGGTEGDVLYGGRGNDYLYGGSGGDGLRGGPGIDMLTGGVNADSFLWRPQDDGLLPRYGEAPQIDTVWDFNRAEGDSIRVDYNLWVDVLGVGSNGLQSNSMVNTTNPNFSDAYQGWVFNPSSHVLWYDYGNAAFQVAVLNGVTDLPVGSAFMVASWL